MPIITAADITRIDQNVTPRTIVDFLSARSSLLSVLPMTPISNSSTIEISNWATASGVGTINPTTGAFAGNARNQATTAVSTFQTVNIGSTLEVTRYDMARASVPGFEPSAIRNVLEALGTNYATRCFRGAAVGTNIFSGISTLTPSTNANDVGSGTNGDALTFDALDRALDLISPYRRGSRFGQIVGFTNSGGYRGLRALLRTSSATSGVRIDARDVMDLPGGTEFPQDILMYNGVPIFKDDLVPVGSRGSRSDLASLIFAVLDDGSRTQGIGGFYTTPVPEEGMIDYGMGVHALPIAPNAADAIAGYNFGWFPGFYAVQPANSLAMITDISF